MLYEKLNCGTHVPLDTLREKDRKSYEMALRMIEQEVHRRQFNKTQYLLVKCDTGFYPFPLLFKDFETQVSDAEGKELPIPSKEWIYALREQTQRYIQRIVNDLH